MAVGIWTGFGLASFFYTLESSHSPTNNQSPSGIFFFNDLTAQWLMAVSTGIIVLLTARGLFYIKKTYDEARATTAVTRRVGEAQTRGYLKVKPKTVALGTFQAINVAIECFGDTPVYDVNGYGTYSYTGDGKLLESKPQRPDMLASNTFFPGDKEQIWHFPLTPTKGHNGDLEKALTKHEFGAFFFVWLRIEWRDALDYPLQQDFRLQFKASGFPVEVRDIAISRADPVVIGNHGQKHVDRNT